MAQRYVKKPIPIEAIEIKKDNLDEIKQWATKEMPIAVALDITTLEGVMHAKEGDYLIKGIKGEIYACERSIFEESYEKLKKEE